MLFFYAHVSADGRKQSIKDHLKGTAELCKIYASAFHSGEYGYLTGLAHDIGKYSESFQFRLLQQGEKVDHSTAGAFECFKDNKPYAAFCIAGHHAGLPNGGSRTDTADQPSLLGRMKRAKNNLIPNYDSWKGDITLPEVSFSPHLYGETLGEDFFTRMLFSCLTDADFLDTERFMSNGLIERDSGQQISALSEKLDQYINNWFPPNSELNRQRCNILINCINRGNDSNTQNGVFTLTVPTGGGKTVASLAFALHHAKKTGKSRVVYVIPYTSIIEQTADSFRSILGSENVLEHHSGIVFDSLEESSPPVQKMMLATENWDKPIIITTAVQFFESIYSNKSSKCRKLHNLVNSVVIFDEAQMLPLEHLRPCISAITQLVGNFGVSAVLCTATQPSLNNLIHEFIPTQEIKELCPKDVFDVSLFQRVSFKVNGYVLWANIAEEMLRSKQSLCIVNTRKSAKDLFCLLKGQKGTYHLSTMMVPAHRKSCLAKIRENLKKGLTCRVVSTSLIEAGVDVDFPMVFREIAGLDSVLQAAGRCNREGKRPVQESLVTVFKSECPIPPLFERNADICNAVISKFDDISSDEAISYYFKELLLLTGDDALDKCKILSKIKTGAFPFASIANDFHLISSDTKTLYIPWGKGVELINRLKAGERGRNLFRESAQYSLSLFSNHFQMLADSGAICEIDKDLDLWYLRNSTLYHEDDGLSLDLDYEQALFV